MLKNFELTAYSNCSREFTLDIDGSSIAVLPVSMISVGKPAIFLLFPPLEKFEDPAVYLDDWASDLRRFTTAFEDYADASFMYQGLALAASDADFCKSMREHLGLSLSTCSVHLFEFDPVSVAVLECMVRADLSSSLAYELAVALSEPIDEEQRGEYFNGLLVDTWRSRQNGINSSHVVIERTELELEALKTLYSDTRNQLETTYLELSDLKIANPRSESPLEVSKELYDSDIVELNEKILALGQEKDLMLLQVTQNQKELEYFYLQSGSLQSKLLSRLPYEAKDLLHLVSPQRLSECQIYLPVLFDSDYYQEQRETKFNAFLHYRFLGWKSGVDPHPLFDTDYYLRNLGISSSSLNQAPLIHYLRIGSRINADTHPHFDSKFYLNEYPDVLQSQIPALLHYLMFGWKEGRNPSKYFETTMYLQAYPDVAESGMNPLIHFVVFGEAEGRRGGKC